MYRYVEYRPPQCEDVWEKIPNPEARRLMVLELPRIAKLKAAEG